MRRAAAVLLTDLAPVPGLPDALEPAAFALALAEDVVDLLAGLSDVDVAIAHLPARRAHAEAIRWPGTHLIALQEGAGPVAALDRLSGLGYDVGAVVAPDVPDLPRLLMAKPFSALSSGVVAYLPADGGGLVALASLLPVPDWLAGTQLSLDADDAVERLRAAAPRRRDVRTTPAWHRIRAGADLRRLDPALEGWDVTRALLGTR